MLKTKGVPNDHQNIGDLAEEIEQLRKRKRRTTPNIGMKKFKF